LSRKLLILDTVLVAVAVYAGVQLRNQWRASKARAAATLNRTVKPGAPPSYAPALPEPPVLASGYAKIAQQTLFDKSRNPDVVIEPPPVAPKPPMPPLPVYHGLMSIGSSGPTAFLSINKDAPHQAVHPGESIGQFKLLDVNSVEMTLEWDGQVIHKRVDELSAMNSAPAAPEAARTDTQPPAAAAPPPAVKSGPGETTAFGFKTCTVNDGQAEGAVVDGYKKVMHQTPFGQSCTWEPSGK